MILQSLTVTNFRNIEQLQFAPAEGINVFYGENGSGKTNLLEAVFTLCLGRSQRGANDSMVLRFGEEFYRLEGELKNNNRIRKVAVAYEKGGRKRTTIDGVKSRISELFGLFCAVAGGPEDNRIIGGSPSARRLFIDMYLSQISQTYLTALTDYQKALAQKNASLKLGVSPESFDDLLVQYGSEMISARIRFIRAIARLAKSRYVEIAGGESLSLAYDPSVPVDIQRGDLSICEIKESFRRKLHFKREREQSARVALVGPHRDDIRIDIGGLPARSHGSQGQWRTAAIALKLAVYTHLKEERAQTPLLLLDEIFAELDSRRTLQLVHMFDDFSQLFITMATQPPAGMREMAHCFRISSGKIQEVI